MWKKPWSMKEGFAIGAAIIAVGIMLQLAFGPIEWSLCRWPVNIALLAAFVLTIVTIHSTKESLYAWRFLSTPKAAVPALACARGLTVVMGLIRQTPDGTWLHGMLTFWPFVLAYVYMTLIVGLVAMKQISRIANRHATRATYTSLVSHIGLFIALTTATLGNGDMRRMKMITAVGETEWRAIDDNHAVAELPIAIELERFIMEKYDDGSPKRFASDIHITTKSGKDLRTTVDVNKPAEVEGWKIYQYSYDTEAGEKSKISIFEIVKDPWLPAVYTGIYMMIAGTILMFASGVRRRNNDNDRPRESAIPTAREGSSEEQ